MKLPSTYSATKVRMFAFVIPPAASERYPCDGGATCAAKVHTVGRYSPLRFGVRRPPLASKRRSNATHRSSQPNLCDSDATTHHEAQQVAKAAASAEPNDALRSAKKSKRMQVVRRKWGKVLQPSREAPVCRSSSGTARRPALPSSVPPASFQGTPLCHCSLLAWYTRWTNAVRRWFVCAVKGVARLQKLAGSLEVL